MELALNSQLVTLFDFEFEDSAPFTIYTVSSAAGFSERLALEAIRGVALKWGDDYCLRPSYLLKQISKKRVQKDSFWIPFATDIDKCIECFGV